MAEEPQTLAAIKRDHPGLLSLPGVKVTIVKYRCYGGETQKPTRIWHNLKYWKPACQWREGQGDSWLRNCKHCSYCKQGIKHSGQTQQQDNKEGHARQATGSADGGIHAGSQQEQDTGGLSGGMGARVTETMEGTPPHRSEKKATGRTKRQIAIQETQRREAKSKRDELQRLTEHMTLNGCGSWVDMQYKNDTDWLYWEEWHRQQMTLRQKTKDGNAAQAASNKTEWKALFAQRAGVKEGVT